MKKYTVYSISIDNTIRYIGRTVNIINRSKQHKASCYNSANKEYNKEFYKYYRNFYPIKQDIVLTPIRTFKNKAKSKRFELYLILDNYFNSKDKLYQRIPNISDKPF